MKKHCVQGGRGRLSLLCRAPPAQRTQQQQATGALGGPAAGRRWKWKGAKKALSGEGDWQSPDCRSSGDIANSW